MRATLAIAVLFALAAPLCCLAAEQQVDLEKLIARADAAGEQKAELYARVVEAEVAAAEHQFAEGQSDAGFASVDAVNDYSDKCLAAAQQHAKKLKEAEIALRKSAKPRKMPAKGSSFTLSSLRPAFWPWSRCESILTWPPAGANVCTICWRTSLLWPARSTITWMHTAGRMPTCASRSGF